MTGKEGHCLGLIGGLGPGATVHYYRALIAAHEAAERVPRMLIAHADVDRVMTAAGAKDFTGLADYLAGLIGSMKAGGAEATAIASHITTTSRACRRPSTKAVSQRAKIAK